MEREIKLPELAESVVEAEVVEWLVAEGEAVAMDQPLLEVASDKVTVELPSPYAGVLVSQMVEVGATVAVGAAVARIAEEEEEGAGEDSDKSADKSSGAAAGTNNQSAKDRAASQASDANGKGDREPTQAAAAKDTADEEDDEGDSLSLFKPSADDASEVRNPFLEDTTEDRQDASEDAAGVAASKSSAAEVRAVPSARIAARRLGIDITKVTGSGPDGRIRAADVRRHADKPAPADQAGSGNRGAAGAGIVPLGYAAPNGYGERERRVPLRGARKAIARQMTDSHLHAVRTLVVEEADMTRLTALRASLKRRAEERGVRLSYLPFVFKALVAALGAYPEVNTSLDEVNGEIVYKDYYSIGLAVATDAGLMVPVVRDVDQRSLLDVAREINRLSEAAREGRLGADELRGATFSVTNIGSIGALFSFPIINVPDAAILGVHSIRERPIAVAGQVEIRPMMYLSLSFDHRLVDGAEASRFLQDVIGLLERPDELLLDAV